MAAAGRGRSALVDTLLALGADASLTSNQGMTAQQWAAQLGFADVAEALDTHAEGDAAAAAASEAAAALADYHVSNDVDRVDLKLIEELLRYICSEGRYAAQAQVRARLLRVCCAQRLDFCGR